MAAEVNAAGGLVLRDGRVCVVHRARYDDWSLPKGKLDDGESFEEAALREVWEETGLRCRLGRELAPARYTVHGRPKLVRYWHMTVSGDCDCGFQPSEEVDRFEWLPIEEAVRRLNYDGERRILEPSR